MLVVRIRKALTALLVVVTLLFSLSLWLTHSERPEVVLLYTQKSKYPDVAFRISSIPLALASYFKTGKRVFSVVPATRKNIESAFSSARVVIIGTHGSDGGIFTDDGGWVGPDSIVAPNMKLIYFGSCYFGESRNRWQAKFPSAKVIGFDELTDPSVGWGYLVFQSWRDLWPIER